jgi:hypothetical protein
MLQLQLFAATLGRQLWFCTCSNFHLSTVPAAAPSPAGTEMPPSSDDEVFEQTPTKRDPGHATPLRATPLASEEIVANSVAVSAAAGQSLFESVGI